MMASWPYVQAKNIYVNGIPVYYALLGVLQHHLFMTTVS